MVDKKRGDNNELDLNTDEDENLVELEDIEYSRKAEFSKAGVVQSAVAKIQEKRAQEMRSGYWNISVSKDGSTKKTYVPDTRREYIGSVEYLKGLLTPEIKTDKKGMESMKTIKKKKQELFDKYSINAINVFNNKIIELQDKYIPEVDEMIPQEIIRRDKRFKIKGREIIQRKGLYNWKVKMYWDEMVKVYDKLFEVLNSLIADKAFFKSKSSF